MDQHGLFIHILKNICYFDIRTNSDVMSVCEIPCFHLFQHNKMRMFKALPGALSIDHETRIPPTHTVSLLCTKYLSVKLL